jgi:hypothetical protein
MTMTLIETKTLDTAQASIEFTSIPQDFTDLVLKVSGRTTGGAAAMLIAFNGSTSNFLARVVLGTGASKTGYSNAREAGTFNGSGDTSNTFNNTEIYIPNYTGSKNKTYSSDSVTENNATSAYQSITAGLWSNIAAITSLAISGSSNLVAGSTISLYGILKGSDGIVTTTP